MTGLSSTGSEWHHTDELGLFFVSFEESVKEWKYLLTLGLLVIFSTFCQLYTLGEGVCVPVMSLRSKIQNVGIFCSIEKVRLGECCKG